METNKQVFDRIDRVIANRKNDTSRGLLDFSEGALQAYIEHETLVMQLGILKINLAALALARKVSEKQEQLNAKS